MLKNLLMCQVVAKVFRPSEYGLKENQQPQRIPSEINFAEGVLSMSENKKMENMTREEAARALEDEMGAEEFKKLVDGADAIIDVSKKFGMPLSQVIEKIKESSEKGLVAKSGDMIIGLEKKSD